MGHMTIARATLSDVDMLDRLVNAAYRGDSSRKGWTTEADLLDGIRTSPSALTELLQRDDTTVLKCMEDDRMIGCVELRQEQGHLYLGMLTVDPMMQGKGTGKVLMHAAEDLARSRGIGRIRMTVITVRHELIAWYERHGYEDTGERKPFPMDDPKFGLPKRHLEFMVLEKVIS